MIAGIVTTACLISNGMNRFASLQDVRRRELEQPDHPAHALFEAVRDTVAGVSSACANVFGATDAALSADVPLLDDNPVPGTSGLPSLRKLIGTGHTVLTF